MKAVASALLFFAGAFSLFSASAVAADAAKKSFTVPLAAVGGSTETGTATFTDTPAGVEVTLLMKHAPAAPLMQPVHIHPGKCPEPNPQPKYPLTTASAGKSTTLLKGVTVASLSGKYTINVHKSTKDFAYVSCGAI